ncbi:MAG: ATP-dependent RNA helicase DbpA [Bacteriovoracaceae bacterium]|nr:ATP-dependent RNA helicase DbpA [Bacteriovoracaceae bacterium]
MNNSFDKLPLRKELIENLAELNFNQMTPIQEKSLPVVLEGKDIIAQAKTGSGKTAAFGLKILNSIDFSKFHVQSIVLCPTRELAEQVATEMRMLARMIKNVKILTLCGGVSEFHQENSLDHGAHIIVGTPGRVLSLLKKKKLILDRAHTLVLDEADRMLDMGFHEDIMNIVFYIPKKRQTLLFSATFPEEIQSLGSNIQEEAVEVKIDVTHEVSSISQRFYKLESHKDKNNALLRVLGKYKPERLIVFCKTKRITDDVADFLYDSGIEAESIHGDLEQNDRTTVLTKFSNRSLSVLVATDVAARGLDIQELEAVINYDLPDDPEVYIHRIGRTGRAGKNGLAFSFFLDRDESKLERIEEYSKNQCQKEEINELSNTEEYGLLPPMRTMYIGGGKKNKLRPGDILGALTGDAGLEADDVGKISILPILTFVAIKHEKIEKVVETLRNGKIKNKKFKVGIT